MLAVISYVLAVIASVIHLAVTKAPRTPRRVVEVLLLYQFVFVVATGGTIGFMGHVFSPDAIAKSIGWPPGSPFQFEVGMADGAFGLLGWLCIFRRGGFWWATAIGYSFFLIGDGIGHIIRLVQDSDFAPANVGTIVPDILAPVLLLGFLVALHLLTRREAGAAAPAAAAAE